MEYAAPRTAEAVPQTFLQRVFAWMFAGLAVTGGVAAAVGASDSFLTDVTEHPWLLIAVFVVQIGLVIVISARAERMSAPVAGTLFFAYAALNGVVFSFIFELYTAQSIFTTFLITAGMFGAMAAWGYFTKADLSSLGSILFMALIGLILATIVNVFVASTALYWITTYAGVAIFAGLTAYDMQKLKQYGQARTESGGAAVNGALALYLDFVNLFLFLLRIFGQARR
jgi:FtsH-binding integral membrane protein